MFRRCRTFLYLYKKPIIVACIIFMVATTARNPIKQQAQDVKAGSWTPLDQIWSMYVYSAIYDDRYSLDNGPVVRLLIVSDKGIERAKSVFYCQLDYGTRSVKYEKVEIFASGVGVPRGAHIIFKEYIFTCPLKAGGIPTKVGISESSSASPAVWIPVEVPEKLREKDFICSCVSTSFGHIEPYRLIEWLELHRMLGVSRVSIYNHSLSYESSFIFEQYAKEGFVHLRQTPHFLMGERDKFSIDIHMSANINDCVLRNMHRCYKIMVTDLDEAIIPSDRKLNTYIDLIKRVEKIPKSPHPARSFTFFNNFFFTDLPEDTTIPEGMVMLRHRWRIAQDNYGFSTKSIIDPQACINMHSHFCWNRPKAMDKKGHTLLVTPEIAKTHHYKACRPGIYQNDSANCTVLLRSAVKDNSILRYRYKLIRNVAAQAAKFGLTSK